MKLQDFNPLATLHWTNPSQLKDQLISGTQLQLPSLEFFTREWLPCNCNLMDLYLIDLNDIFINRFFNYLNLIDFKLQQISSFKEFEQTRHQRTTAAILILLYLNIKQISYFTVLSSTYLIGRAQ